MRYIIEKHSGNPRILELQEDGSYTTIAFGAGEESFNKIKNLIDNANKQELNAEFAKMPPVNFVGPNVALSGPVGPAVDLSK